MSEQEEPRIWKEDWPQARAALVKWWEGRGLALHITAPKDEPWEDVPAPPAVDVERQWLDPCHRLQAQRWWLSRTYFGGVAFPAYSVDVGGPGSLGLFLGCGGRPAPDTVWYDSCIADPERHPPLSLDTGGRWWRLHVEAIEQALSMADGRWVVGFPDLIENIDTLAQLRGPEETLTDLLARPQWVKQKLAEINRAWFQCFEALEAHLKTPWGGNAWTAFSLWGPGRTAKLQCDFSCMISPAMFREFVMPPLVEHCAWLDYALYHLDGTQALPQLDNLLSIPGLHAIEWTPQAGLPGGGSPEWYDLYHRIKAGGKCVQAVGVAYDEVEPLIEAVGAEGIYIMASAPSESAARDLLKRTGWPSS